MLQTEACDKIALSLPLHNHLVDTHVSSSDIYHRHKAPTSDMERPLKSRNACRQRRIFEVRLRLFTVSPSTRNLFIERLWTGSHHLHWIDDSWMVSGHDCMVKMSFWQIHRLYYSTQCISGFGVAPSRRAVSRSIELKGLK